MAGNVYQWVQDTASRLEDMPVDGSAHEPENENARLARIVRGGSFQSNGDEKVLQADNRSNAVADVHATIVGFRLARSKR